MSFHGYSEDEESPVLQNFVNETIARQTQTPSPRTELLSPTSPRAALPGEIGRPRRSRRGPSDRYRRQREAAYANLSSRQLLSLLIEKEYEASRLRKALQRTFDSFEVETRRVSDSERVTQEALAQLRTVNESRNAAERALSKATEELGLWKFQFDHAQAELARAQDVVRLVERQRDDAEDAASKARATARQLNELRLVTEASEEGWRLGYQAGFRRAQDDLAFVRGTASPDTYQDLEEIENGGGGRYTALQPENAGGDDQGTGDSPPESIRPPEDLRMRQVSPSHSQQPPPTTEAPPSMPSPIFLPNPFPVSPTRAFETETEPVDPAPPSFRTPSPRVSIYPIEIPPPSLLNDQPANYPPQRRVSSRTQRPQYQPPSQPDNNPPGRAFTSQLSEEPQYQRPPEPAPLQRRSPAQFQQQQPQQDPRPPLENMIPPQRRSPYQFQQQLDPGSLPPENIIPSQRRSLSQFQQQQDPGLPPSEKIVPPQRPLSQAASQRSRRSTNTQAPPRSPQQPQYRLPPDNYIPSASEDGGIALPPPFQLSHPVLSAMSPKVAPVDPPRKESWYNREEQQQGQGQQQQQGQTQSWYQPKRPRSNAGSVSGLSAAGSTAGRSAQGRHARQASSDSRLSAKSQKLAASQPYAADLGAIREVDARSVRSGQGYAGSQRVRSVSEVESVPPPPPPPKDERHQKQMIADELRYSDPDLAESWRREGASAKAASLKSQPPRNVRVPPNLTFPSPLSPPTGPVPLGHMRARTMSGSTGKSGGTQPLPVDLGRVRSLRHVTPRRAVSPSDAGTPYFGTITIEPPSQSSSQIPLTDSAPPPTDQYLTPNYQTQPLPQAQVGQVGQPGTGFVPQTITIPGQITMPVTFKGKAISSPITPSVPFPGEDGGDEPRPVSIYRASAHSNGASPRHSRAGSAASLNVEQERPLSRARSNSALSRKSEMLNVGPTLTAGPALSRQASNASLRSNTSLRSTGSAYAQFDPKTYIDPAYFAADHNAPRSRKVSASSNHSGLSYIGPPGPP
ncbi:hypothetical protein B0H12DRAFT_1324242 [Mycena haematopus]|nr:hypothetical protein B0H12DRAFT_1324242 [Mycena haematopus]